MRNRTRIVMSHRFSTFLLALGLAGVAQATEAPVAVSPGEVLRLALVESRCPTFSWGAISDAKGYELVVYRVDEDLRETEPVLRQAIAGSALGWTPSLESCLERGGQYAWSVRAVGRKGSSEWSAPSLFEVAAGPSEAELEAALDVVRQFQRAESTGTVTQGVEPPSGGASTLRRGGPVGGASAGPALLSVAAGDSALQVNGSAVVTTATLGAGVACWSVEPGKFYRYVDLGDGTVLDCNTGLIWLKGASCLGFGPWGSVFTAGTAQNIVADLNNKRVGTPFPCADYMDGTYADWRLPTISEFCSAWAGSGLFPCPSAAATGSLIDSSLSGAPFVRNASGAGQWAEGDAFVGVQSVYYWSATGGVGGVAWCGSVNTAYVTICGETSNQRIWPVRGGQ